MRPDLPALLCDVARGIATITISNPAKRNVMTTAMWSALPSLLAELAAERAVRVVVLQGAGDTFCAGADISNLTEVVDSAGPALPALAEQALAAFGKPTIASVRGYCIGGGVQLAVACDLRIAADDARFAITPAKLGVVYQASAVGRLVDLVGRSRAKHLLFSAEQVDASYAERVGLVERVVPTDDLAAVTAAYAATIAGRSQLTIQATKSFIAALSAPDGLDQLEQAWRDESQRSGEYAEGVRAFTERREPRFPWTGAGAPE